MTEAEKRERRALERKLSEMEEELKVSFDLFFFFSSSSFFTFLFPYSAFYLSRSPALFFFHFIFPFY